VGAAGAYALTVGGGEGSCAEALPPVNATTTATIDKEGRTPLNSMACVQAEGGGNFKAET
jgi:hypothetical protein